MTTRLKYNVMPVALFPGGRSNTWHLLHMHDLIHTVLRVERVDKLCMVQGNLSLPFGTHMLQFHLPLSHENGTYSWPLTLWKHIFMNSVYFVHVHTYRMAQHIFEFVWVSPISPTPICLLPFHLLNIKLCHFAYFFFNAKTNIPATELAFSTTRGEGVLFPLCSSPKSEDIHTWASFIHQTVAPVCCAFDLYN